jgi:hypothetical protein
LLDGVIRKSRIFAGDDLCLVGIVDHRIARRLEDGSDIVEIRLR